MKSKCPMVECIVCGKSKRMRTGTLCCSDRCRQRRHRSPLLFGLGVVSAFANAPFKKYEKARAKRKQAKAAGLVRPKRKYTKRVKAAAAADMVAA